MKWIKYFTRSASFTFSIFYLLVEYLRPQDMYIWLKGVPLAQVCILLWLFSCVVEGRLFRVKAVMNVCVVLYFLQAFLSYLCAYYHLVSWYSLVDFSKTVLVYFLLINSIKDKEELLIALVVIILIYLKFAQFAFRAWVGNGFYIDERTGMAGGVFFRNASDYGVAMSMIFPIALYLAHSCKKKKFKLLYYFATLFFIINLLITASRAAVLAGLIILLLIIIRSRKKIKGLIVSAIIVLVLANYTADIFIKKIQRTGKEIDATGQTRLKKWRIGMDMAKQDPLTGVGIGGYANVSVQTYGENGLLVHNVFIQSASELGYPGLILLIIIILRYFYDNHKGRKRLKHYKRKSSFLYNLTIGFDFSMVGFIITGFFVTVLYYPFLWVNVAFNVVLQVAIKKEIAGLKLNTNNLSIASKRSL